MTVVAIIPARGGSKGIPRKNLMTVGGRTLVERSIDHAKESRRITRILVSTEDREIRAHAMSFGVEVVDRPEELATDEANGDEIILHALEAIGCTGKERPDHLTVFLQPTSPFRRPKLIDEGVDVLRRNAAYDCWFTVTLGHFTWRYERVEGPHVTYRIVPVVGTIDSRRPRQLIPMDDRLFHENGCVYVTRTRELFRTRNRVSGEVTIREIGDDEAIDIDEPYHLWLANQRADYLRENPSEAREVVVTETGAMVFEKAT